MLKRIIILEPEFLIEETLTLKLGELFPKVHKVNFSAAADLLKYYKEFAVGDIIITERRLPLLSPTEDIDMRIGEIQTLFPRTIDWDHRNGGEILVDCLREKGITCPAIIYTTSGFGERLGSEGYVCDPQTVFCGKKDNFDNLILAIRKIASSLIKVRTHPCL
jgi:hypothetical protein